MLGIFLDSETNGLNPQIHRMLEIAFKVVDLKTGEVRDSYQAVLRRTEEEWRQSDPESLKINGFTQKEVAVGKTPEEVRQEILTCFSTWGIRKKKAVFICQNPSFDRVFFSQLIPVEMQEGLNMPYHWLDLASMHWALTLERAKKGLSSPPWEIGYSKDLIAAFYRLPAEAKPHRAMNGVSHLLLCYASVVGFLV